MSRRKKKSSPPPIPTTSDQQQELWHRHFEALPSEKQELIQRETSAARAASGSRLAVASHLTLVHDVLCQGLENPKQKSNWTLFLQVTLPGLATSRSQTFRDIKAWRLAKESVLAPLLNEFLASGYALSVRPTAAQPLGKMTEACKHVLSSLDSEKLSEEECKTVLAEAARIVQREAKENRSGGHRESVDEKRNRIFKEIHTAVIGGIDGLALAIERGDKYRTSDVRDDLEEIVCRLLTATGIDTLELEQRLLPEGYRRLKLPAPASKPRKAVTRSPGSGARVARAVKHESSHTGETVTSNGTIPVSPIAVQEVPSVV